MADLSSLIRLHKHELDEKQREIGRLYEGYNQLSLQRDQLRQRREEEVLAAQESPDKENIDDDDTYSWKFYYYYHSFLYFNPNFFTNLFIFLRI